MSEQELKEYAKQRGWSFVRVPAMACSGYWRDKEGNAYYARKQEQLTLPLKRENNRRGK